MTRLQLLDKLFSVNRDFKNLGIIQRHVAIRYTNLAIMYLYPCIVDGKFNTQNAFVQIDLATELKEARYIEKGE